MSRPHRFLPSPAMAVATLALVAAAGGQPAYAAATNFLLNAGNTSTAQTTLNGSAVAGKALQITNSNTATGATALGLNVAAGHAPFTVNSTAKVAKLNADQLDGKDSTAFLPAGGTATNAEMLDGIDSTAFVNGGGSATGVAYAIDPGARSPLFTFGPGWSVFYNCPANTANPGSLVIVNSAVVGGTSVGTNLFFEPVVSSPVYSQMPPNSSTSGLPATPSGQVWAFRMQTNGSIATLEVATVNRGIDCHFQAQALVTTY